MWIPKKIEETIKELPEEDADLILDYIKALEKQLKEPQIIPIREFPMKGTELNVELRKNGKVLNLLSIPEPKGKLIHFSPKNPNKRSLLVLKNHFARLELFYYKMSQEKLFLSVNGEWFEFENGNEGKISSKILNYDKNISPIHKRRRKRYK